MAKKSIWNQCGRKNRYRDEHTANYYCRVLGEERGVKLDYYWCAYCNGFHLTSGEFRPEGYGLRQDESGEWIHMGASGSRMPVIRRYYMGKKYSKNISMEEFEKMYAG